MTHFYKLGQQQALMELGLLKNAQGSIAMGTRPPNAPKPAKVPPPPPPKPAPLMGGRMNQVKTLRREGIFGV